MLHRFTKRRLYQMNLVSCFDKIIDFLDKRNEVDLISHGKVFDTVPCGKLLRQVPERQDGENEAGSC